MPKVSIIIPTYNHSKFITEAIESALNQTYTNIETIVIDDGSTDNTRSMCKKYKNKIKYIAHPINRGFPQAMNTGLRNAKGKYFIILSADDKLHKDCINKEVNILEKNPNIGLVHSPYLAIDDKGSVIMKKKKMKPYIGTKNDYLFLIIGNYISLANALVRTKLAKKVGFFNTNLRQHPDWDMWLKIAYISRFAYVDEYLSYYRIHKSTLTEEVRRNIRKIGPEKKIVLSETIKEKVPNKLKPFIPFIYIDAKIDLNRLPYFLSYLIFAISVISSKVTRLLFSIFD